mmetsp:Transcript_577/g.738  ORF Transcript_577/g.738 Transcript_577/m.738 type:complete len:89 (+) Transcript_577:362-628(+)
MGVTQQDDRKEQDKSKAVPEEESKSPVKESGSKGGFTLGVKNLANEDGVERGAKATKQGRSVTLRRLMPDTQGKSLDEIKQYHERLIA